MIELRDLVRDDAERTFLWRREREVDRWMYQTAPSDYGLHVAWLEDVLASADKVGWIIEENGRPCGFLMLKGLADTQQRAQWGWYIGEAAARGRGAGRAAQALGLDRAFFDYGVQKVWSEVQAGNEIALKAQAAAGFRREATCAAMPSRRACSPTWCCSPYWSRNGRPGATQCARVCRRRA